MNKKIFFFLFIILLMLISFVFFFQKISPSSIFLPDKKSSPNALSTLAGDKSEMNFLQEKFSSDIIRFAGKEAFLQITDSGATKGNTKSDTSYALENQRIAYSVVATGIIDSDPLFLDKGLKAFEWGFSKQKPDGSFPGEKADDEKEMKYQHIHPISFFVESATRSVLLIQASSADNQYKERANALIPKIALAAKYMNNSSNLDSFFTNAANTNQLATVALTLQEVAILTDDLDLEKLSGALVKRILERQMTDGAFPEKKNFDASYQTVTLEALARYSTVTSDLELKNAILSSLEKGFQKELTAIRADGTVDTSKNTRTEVCGTSVPGEGPKGRDIDIIPYRLYYYGYITNQLEKYEPIAKNVLRAGQGFNHIGDCKESN